MSSQVKSFSVFSLGLLSSSKGNHMLSATSHIGLEFFNNFLNMVQSQYRLILKYLRLRLQIYHKTLISGQSHASSIYQIIQDSTLCSDSQKLSGFIPSGVRWCDKSRSRDASSLIPLSVNVYSDIVDACLW